jgi:preprotein translocase subunit SecB
MSDTDNAADTGAADAANESPVLNIDAQYLKDLSFENPGAPASLVASTEAPNINVSVDVGAKQIGEAQFEVEISVTADASRADDKIFLCEAVYAGIFTLKNFPPEALEPVCLIECPRFIFPFLRRIVADATRDGGFPPLMLEPIDFAQLYQSSRQAAGSDAVN